MTPEAHARRIIDRQLADAGWLVQDLKTAHLGAATGIAVREFITDAGPADYVLFVDRRPVGVIEAKREEAGETLTATEPQTAGCAQLLSDDMQDGAVFSGVRIVNPFAVA